MFGKFFKKDDGYDNIWVIKNSWDFFFCFVNLKYIVIIIELVGGGLFFVLLIK